MPDLEKNGYKISGYNSDAHPKGMPEYIWLEADVIEKDFQCNVLVRYEVAVVYAMSGRFFQFAIVGCILMQGSEPVCDVLYIVKYAPEA